MATGMLTVTGKLDTSQFWPTGRSDADTVKVSVMATSFAFTPDPKKQKDKVTTVFQGAQVQGKGKTPAIKNGSITIRLQDIDAPELHYAGKSTSNGNLESRFSPQEVFQDLPGDLVFFEQPSTLVDAKGNKITKFF